MTTDTPRTMTPAQINRRIAEACGWRQSERNIAHWHHVSEPYSHIFNRDLPNYHGDLNAMHEAEKILNTKELWESYKNHMLVFMTEPVCATARQRAEAFLRTLGKWEDDK